MEPPLFTRANDEGRRLFTRRPPKWSALLIWGGMIVGAVWLGATIVDRDGATAALALGCTSFALVAMAAGVLLRVFVGRA